VYVLRSLKDGGLYVGLSSRVEVRKEEHNAGYNRSTRSRGPFELFYVERCNSRVEARKREKYLKSGVGREFLGAAYLKMAFRNGAGVTQR
jgi:putative endonuclease